MADAPHDDDSSYTGTPMSVAPRRDEALQRGNKAADPHDDQQTDPEHPVVEADHKAEKAITDQMPPLAPPPDWVDTPFAAKTTTPRPAAGAKASSNKRPATPRQPTPLPVKASAATKTPVPAKAPAPEPQPAANASSRRTAVPSSRRTAVPSNRRTSLSSGRLRSARSWWYIGVGSLVIVVVVALIFIFGGTPDKVRRAQDTLAEARRIQGLFNTALANHRAAEARTNYDAALALLTGSAELGQAAEMPASDPQLVPDLARQAHTLRRDIEELRPRLVEIENENQADANLAALKARLAAISAPATDIDILERDIQAFIANPVDPKAGANEDHAGTFARLVGEARLRLVDVAAERKRRTDASSVTPVRQAQLEMAGFIQEERFQAALDRLDALAKANPAADFTQVRANVTESAARAWQVAKNSADTKLADWKAPGVGEEAKRRSLAAAKERLQRVVDTFGMDQYVSQAKAMLAKLP